MLASKFIISSAGSACYTRMFMFLQLLEVSYTDALHCVARQSQPNIIFYTIKLQAVLIDHQNISADEIKNG
jgi:hypothetical protein